MRIPRLAFAAMIAGIVALVCTLAVVKVGADSNGTVVLLNTRGPDGPLMDCPLSTLDKNQATCDWYGKSWLADSSHIRSDLLSGVTAARSCSRFVHAYTPREITFPPSRLTADPATKVKEVWFEPGEC